MRWKAHINFLNILPLTYSYRNGYANGLDIKYNVPSILNDDLANKRLDISHISSIVYARLNDDLLLLPNICIRADRDVESIMLISRVPIEKLNGEKIIFGFAHLFFVNSDKTIVAPAFCKSVFA